MLICRLPSCRKMQKPLESHPRLLTSADGHTSVRQVTCARVYHINVILRVRARSTLAPSVKVRCWLHAWLHRPVKQPRADGAEGLQLIGADF